MKLITMKILAAHIVEIKQLCLRHKVKHLYAFGSILTDRFTKDSDIDLMVDFEPIPLLDYADNYFDLMFSLEDLLQRPIDLLEVQAVNNPYFAENVYSTRQLIYG